MEDIFIVGTDTDVGKSVVSLLVMQSLFEKGYSPFYVKPFQTGCKDPYDKDSDAAFVYRHTVELRGQDPAGSVICCYPNPKAPYFAARDAGDEINISQVEKHLTLRRNRYSPLIIEAAGGLIVPVAEGVVIADLIAVFKCRPLLVARAGLGTINHTLLSIRELRRREVEPLGVVFVDLAEDSTSKSLAAENIEAIESLSGIQVSGVIGHIKDFNRPDRSSIQVIEKILS